MTWQREAFREHYRATIGTAASSNSYVSYLNRTNELVDGLDERIAAVGGDTVVSLLSHQSDQRFTKGRSRTNCVSALRAYLNFVEFMPEPAPSVARVAPEEAPIPSMPVRDEMIELLRQAKALAARYYRLTGKPLGVTGEVAELEAAEKLGLILLDARSPDVDALGDDGLRVQVKGRAVPAHRPYRGRCPSIKGEAFDSVVLVLLDQASYNALEIWEAPRDRVLARIAAPGSKARNQRRSLGIAQFKSISERVWPAASVA